MKNPIMKPGYVIAQNTDDCLTVTMDNGVIYTFKFIRKIARDHLTNPIPVYTAVIIDPLWGESNNHQWIAL